MKMALRLVSRFCLSLALMLIGDHHRHPYHCDDCFALHGFPFVYRNDGGFAGGSAFHCLDVEFRASRLTRANARSRKTKLRHTQQVVEYVRPQTEEAM